MPGTASFVLVTLHQQTHRSSNTAFAFQLANRCNVTLIQHLSHPLIIMKRDRIARTLRKRTGGS